MRIRGAGARLVVVLTLAVPVLLLLLIAITTVEAQFYSRLHEHDSITLQLETVIYHITFIFNRVHDEILLVSNAILSIVEGVVKTGEDSILILLFSSSTLLEEARVSAQVDNIAISSNSSVSTLNDLVIPKTDTLQVNMHASITREEAETETETE